METTVAAAVGQEGSRQEGNSVTNCPWWRLSLREQNLGEAKTGITGHAARARSRAAVSPPASVKMIALFQLDTPPEPELELEAAEPYRPSSE